MRFNKHTYAKNKKYCRIEINMIDVNALSENKVYNTMLESIGRDKVKIYEYKRFCRAFKATFIYRI